MSMDEQADILSDAERQALAAVSAPAVPASSVLVVDDNTGNREALCIYLRSRGWDCTEAGSVKQALAALTMRPSIGLIITDLRMQPEDGLSLIRQVRTSERAELPIIVVSGDTDVQEAVKAMHLGVLDVLLKPVDLDRLLELVRKELNP
ncbi:response regulator [Pseudomonas sp. RP23018S]|uniref:response regulator n=1 Tax=Pseudomonas sp. RP23018S TaxID=3096037 RepID=UPI002ACA2698|nr:response regulator [Pseudomonas sp. RP23018S]MDZ5604103.1 response regulator [Pseudomonas sp. RP23018S]